MLYMTDLMQDVLTSTQAKRIIDYVSRIYGDSYVGLWIFQSIGTVLDEVYDESSNLRYETNPAQSTDLLDYYEEHYGLPKNTALTTQQRRLRIIAKIQARGPCNPVRLAKTVSAALGGAEVDITERYATNTFLVNVREVIDDLSPAYDVLDRNKPAHLIYTIRTATQMQGTSTTKLAIAVTHSEQHHVEVQQP